MQTKKSTKLVKPIKLAKADSANMNNVRSFGLIYFFVIIIFLFIAAVSINLFRADLSRTINLRNVEPAGFVVIRKNVVQRRLADRVLWDRLASESPVYIGDLIRVAELSAASLHIDGNSLDLNENTLIRLMRAPDGDGLQIMMSEGSLSLTTTRNSGRLSLDVNGRQVQLAADPPSGDPALEESEAEWVPAVINVISMEDGLILQVNEGTALFFEEGQIHEVTAGNRVSFDSDGFVHTDTTPPVSVTRYPAAPVLQSPVNGSVFRFYDEPQVNPPVIRFFWAETDNAYSYILEVCDTPYFTTPQIIRESQAAFFAQTWFEDEYLKTGRWYWRVKPVYPSIFVGTPSFSQISYFSVERVTVQPETEELGLAEWFTREIPSGLILEPEQEQKIAEEATISLLPAAQNLRPARGHRITMNELQTRRSLNFSWQAVRGANAYIVTFYHQTETGRRQVFQTQPVSRAGYLLEDLRFLDRGTFFWEVEAVSRGQGGVIERHGNIAESSFIMDIFLPGAVQIEGARELNEN